MTSSPEQQQRSRHTPAGVAAAPATEQPVARVSRRRVLGLLGVGIAGLLPLAGCGGDDEMTATATAGADATPDGPPVVAATFTPRPATPTPGASPTSDGSPTVQAQATISPDSSPAPGEPTPTQAPNEIRAPLVRLGTDAGDDSITCWVSEFTWYDPELESVGGRFALPYAELPPARLSAGVNDTLEVRVDASPYPITAAEIDLYPWEGNVALPTNAAGEVVSEAPVFYRQTEALFSETLSGAVPLQTQPGLPAGTYIAAIRVDWTLPEDIAQALGRPVYVICVVAIDLS